MLTAQRAKRRRDADDLDTVRRLGRPAKQVDHHAQPYRLPSLSRSSTLDDVHLALGRSEPASPAQSIASFDAPPSHMQTDDGGTHDQEMLEVSRLSISRAQTAIDSTALQRSRHASDEQSDAELGLRQATPTLVSASYDGDIDIDMAQSSSPAARPSSRDSGGTLSEHTYEHMALDTPPSSMGLPLLSDASQSALLCAARSSSFASADQVTPRRSAFSTGLTGWGSSQTRAGSSGEGEQEGDSRPPTAGKVRITMGYRKDCPKCVARIPGHYVHWLPA